MKKLYLVIILFISILFMAACSSDNSSDINDPAETGLVYKKTVPGGCNDMAPGEISSFDEEPDTLIFTEDNGKLNAFVGINYVCCAPFETSCSIRDNLITMTIEDVCDFGNEDCYCFCMCYYTFDFKFENFDDKVYYYKVILKDPRQSGEKILWQGKLDI